MKIGILEPFPLLESRLQALFESSLLPSPPRDAENTEDFFDLILSDRNYFDDKSLPPASLYLISGEILPESLPESGLVITGRMNSSDTVTLSSIGEDRAMLCLQREIFLNNTFIGPFERAVPYDRNYNLYKNLAAGFALALTLIFREEENQ